MFKGLHKPTIILSEIKTVGLNMSPAMKKIYRFLIGTNFIKFLAIIFLIIAICKMPDWYYTAIKFIMYALLIPFIYFLAKHKNVDHSVGIAGSVIVLFVFNPFIKSNWRQLDWIMADYCMIAFFVAWIIHDIIRHQLLMKELKNAKYDFLDSFKKPLN
jgi:hypothetical protein